MPSLAPSPEGRVKLLCYRKLIEISEVNYSTSLQNTVGKNIKILLKRNIGNVT